MKKAPHERSLLLLPSGGVSCPQEALADQERGAERAAARGRKRCVHGRVLIDDVDRRAVGGDGSAGGRDELGERAAMTRRERASLGRYVAARLSQSRTLAPVVLRSFACAVAA